MTAQQLVIRTGLETPQQEGFLTPAQEASQVTRGDLGGVDPAQLPELPRPACLPDPRPFHQAERD